MLGASIDKSDLAEDVILSVLFCNSLLGLYKLC